MRTGARIPRLGLFLCGAALLGGLAVASAVAQQPAVTPASPKDAKPPAFPKRFFRNATGQLYVPAGVPVGLGITLTGSSAASDGSQTDNSNESSVVLKEGPTSLDFGGARVPVVADGTPPKTLLAVDDPSDVVSDGVRILPSAPKLVLSAADALSGVARTLISLDGASFVPLPSGGPVVTAEGVHTLRFFSVDHVGNAEPLQSYTFRVDGTAPKTELTTTGPRSGSVMGAGARLTLAAQDSTAGVDLIRYQIDKIPEQTYERPFLLDEISEGPHQLVFFAIDRVRNKETAQTFSFRIDRQPPAIALAIHGPLYSDRGVRYISPKAEIELTGRDTALGAPKIRYIVDGAAAAAYTVPFQLPSNSGIHPLRLESGDAVDNRVEINVDDIFVDSVAPATEVQYSRPFFVQDGVVVLNPGSKIQLNARDLESGVASVSYTLDGGPPQNYTQPFSVAALGDHRLTVASVDHVGNQEPLQTIRLHIEPAGIGEPVPQVLDAKRFYEHPQNGLMGPPDLPFVVRISASPDPGAESFILSSSPTPSAGSQLLTFGAPGKTSVAMAMGKQHEGFAIAIDSAPPRTQMDAGTARRNEVSSATYIGPGLKIAFSAEDAPEGVVSGLWKTLYSVDGAPFATYSKPLTEFTREGKYALRYYSLDNVGNTETTHSFNFTVDTTPPVTQMQFEGPHFASTVAPATRVALTATDNLSGVTQIQYQVDGGKVQPYAQPFAIGNLGDGRHQLAYYAVDAVGNRELEHTLPFTIQSKVGATSYEVRGRSVVRGGTVFVTPGSQVILKCDNGTPILYSLDGETPKTYGAPIPTPESGTHRLVFHAQDELGNAGPMHTVLLAADHSAPNSSLHLDGPQLRRENSILITGATRIILDASAGAMGGATLEYSLGGNHWQPYTGPFTIKAAGNYDVTYRAHNPLAATGAPQHQRLTVHPQGPAITVTYSVPVAGDPVRFDPGTLMFISASDEPAGLEKITYKLDDQPPLIYRAPLSGFTPGKTHTITIDAQDLLENHSEKVVRLVVKEQSK